MQKQARGCILPSHGLEHAHCQRRQGQVQRTGPPLPGNLLRLKAALVAHVAAPVDFRVAVEHLGVITLLWHADAIALAGDRCKVAHDNQVIRGGVRLAHVGDAAVFPVVKVYPLILYRTLLTWSSVAL